MYVSHFCFIVNQRKRARRVLISPAPSARTTRAISNPARAPTMTSAKAKYAQRKPNARKKSQRPKPWAEYFPRSIAVRNGVACQARRQGGPATGAGGARGGAP